MGFWTLDRVAQALGAGPRGSAPIAGVSTDTRTVGAGELFVALVGEHFDGYDFLATAVERGCAAVVVSRPAARIGVPVYQVADTTAALGVLGRYRRRAWGGPVVAVAGSNGKTTTKELLRAALGSMLTVHATQGNLNNQIGVPQTLLAVPDDADIAVVEVGTNVPGEIAILRSIVEPQIAVMTSIGEEHLEGLHDLEGVLAEESAIFDGVGLAVVPSGQPEIGRAATGRAARVVSAGLDAGDVQPKRWAINADGSCSRARRFEFRCAGRTTFGMRCSRSW
jgi:UDP-N-acetylmuramoyl-tripeptide--D-alanyl-D-alanine ligase